jgi:hypothetical protein
MPYENSLENLNENMNNPENNTSYSQSTSICAGHQVMDVEPRDAQQMGHWFGKSIGEPFLRHHGQDTEQND